MSFSSDNPTLSNQVPVSLEVNPEEKNFNATLMLYLRRMANSVNTKDQAIYLLQETGNFQQWFNHSTPVVISQNRNGYRITLDFVALNGAPIGPTATITLTATTQPPAIIGYMFPTRGFGGALSNTGISYFPSDPNVSVTYNNSTNTFSITNTTGNTLTQFYWVMEYLKN
jgi:hypothetical protein